MATKTISIELDVYERLRALKRSPSESFSMVLRRELPHPMGASAADVLIWSEEPGGILGMGEEGLARVEAFRRNQSTWKDPWTS
jgi:predicted CopG family antitoxin